MLSLEFCCASTKVSTTKNVGCFPDKVMWVVNLVLTAALACQYRRGCDTFTAVSTPGKLLVTVQYRADQLLYQLS